MSRIITIGREFGSGGRELGRRLAGELHMEYYDKEIISEISKRTSLSEKYIQEVIEQKPHPLFPITIGRSFSYMENPTFKLTQSVYQEQSHIIREMAAKSDCVIVGRCAEYILKECKPFRIFVYADMESKMKRCRDNTPADEQLSNKELKQKILLADKGRSGYYHSYTDQIWGEKLNYDLCINTTQTVIKEMIPALAKMFC